MQVVAGVDSSTQSCKVELRDLTDGRVLGRGSAPHPRAHAPRSEQDPHAWWSAFEAAFAAAVTAAGCRASDIVSISVAGQCHGLVPMDSGGEVIRPAKLWNDTTSTPQLERLTEAIGARRWIETIGSLPTAAFTLSKIAWLAEHEPANFARLARICLPHDWLTYRLTGEHVTDRSEASGTGYYDSRAGVYVEEFLSLIDSEREWATMLPRVLGPNEAAGVVLPDVAAALGLGDDVLVGPGAGDQHAAALGLAIEPGDVVYSLGTSGVVYTTSTEPVYDWNGYVNGVADTTGGYLPLVCTLNAARVTDWAARMLGVDHRELSRLALAARPDQTPVMAAFLDGERSPDRPQASGVLAGITAATTREGLARAAHEGVLLGMLRGQRWIEAAGVEIEGRVLVTGGGARSQAYRQILADLTGRPVLLPDPDDADEATARGAAIQAAAVATGRPVTELRAAWAPEATPVARPRPGSASELLTRYEIVAEWNGFDGQAADVTAAQA